MKKLELSTLIEITVALALAFSLAFFLHDSGATLLKIIRTGGEVFLVPFVFAAFLSYILEPWVSSYERKGMSRFTSVLLIDGMLVTAALVIALLVYPYLHREASHLQSELPHYTARFKIFLASLEDFLNHSTGSLGHFSFAESLMNYNRQQGGTDSIESALQILKVSTLFLLFVPLFSFTMLHDGQHITRFVVRYIPNRYFVPTLMIVDQVHRNLGNYIRGVFAEAAIVGAIATIGFYLVGLQYFWLFGFLAGAFNLIPVFGPATSMLLACGFSLLQTGSVSQAIGVLSVLLFGQLIDHFILMPLLLFRSASVHFITGFLAIIVGGKAFGVMGMLLAVPLVSIVKLVSQEIVRNVRWRLSHPRQTPLAAKP